MAEDRHTEIFELDFGNSPRFLMKIMLNEALKW